MVFFKKKIKIKFTFQIGGLMVAQDAFWPLNYKTGESAITTAMVHSIHRFYRRPRQPPPSPKPAPGRHTSSHGPYLTPCCNVAASPPPPISQEFVLSH